MDQDTFTLIPGYTRLHDLAWKLIPALIAVESGGDAQCVGDGGDALGVLQIRQICVDDINRILGGHWYTHHDAIDPDVSKQICIRYLIHYGAAYEVETYGPATAEVLARIWNGGPRGWAKQSTEKYWKKVEVQLSMEEANDKN